MAGASLSVFCVAFMVEDPFSVFTIAFTAELENMGVLLGLTVMGLVMGLNTSFFTAWELSDTAVGGLTLTTGSSLGGTIMGSFLINPVDAATAMLFASAALARKFLADYNM